LNDVSRIENRQSGVPNCVPPDRQNLCCSKSISIWSQWSFHISAIQEIAFEYAFVLGAWYHRLIESLDLSYARTPVPFFIKKIISTDERASIAGAKQEFFLEETCYNCSHHERLSKLQAMAIFGADALSSTAYATERDLLVLAGVAVMNLDVAAPIAIAIVLLICVAIRIARWYRISQDGGVFNVAVRVSGLPRAD
jgi:hypothetical protein